jgi:3-hydroxybutyryl-CoA dehydrogenase
MRGTKNICIVGAGRMGIGISTAILMANRGYRIELVDMKDRQPCKEFETLNRAKKQIKSNLELLKELGEISRSPENMMVNLKLTHGLEKGLIESEIVFEALPEKPEIKQHFIKSIEPIIHKESIIASATSTISLDTFWEVSSRPENLITTHWLNPAFIIPLVEISIGDQTSNQKAEKITEFLIEVGKVPVKLKNSPGFILPRIQTAAMNEAIRILVEGIATAEDIDTAIKAGFGFRLAILGLIEFIDLGGVDILYHASNYLYTALGQPQFKLLESINRKMANKEIGPSAGKGFFDYAHVNTESMFRNRYIGFLELLNLVKRSKVLNFRGGIGDA